MTITIWIQFNEKKKDGEYLQNLSYNKFEKINFTSYAINETWYLMKVNEINVWKEYIEI